MKNAYKNLYVYDYEQGIKNINFSFMVCLFYFNYMFVLFLFETHGKFKNFGSPGEIFLQDDIISTNR